MTVAEMWVKIGADISDLQNKMKSAASVIEESGKRMRDVGLSLTATVTAPLVGIGAAAFKASTDFNEAMANITSLMSGSVPEVARRAEEYKKIIQDMAIQFGLSTKDLAGGLYQVISALGEASDSIEVLKINALAAKAGLATTTEAINLTSAVTKGYGDTSAEAVKKVADLAFQTVKLGQTTFPELAASMGRVVPIAKTLGVSQEELFAVMATATGVTGNAAEVVTQLRSAMQAFMAPTKEMSSLLEQLGFSSGEAMIQQLGLHGALQKIVEAAKESGTPLQKFMGRVEGQTLALSLAGSLADSYSEKLVAMKNSVGALDDAFRKQTEGVNKLGYQWEQLKQKLIVLAQKLGDALIPAFMSLIDAAQPLIDFLVKIVNWFAKLPEPVQKVAVGFAAFAAAAGPVLTVVGQMMVTFGKLTSFFGLSFLPAIAKITPAVSGIAPVFASVGAKLLTLVGAAGPWGLAIAGLAGAGVLIYKNWDKIAAFFKATWEGIANTAKTVWGGIKSFFGSIWEGYPEFIRKVWSDISTFLGAAWRGIADFASATWSGIKSGFSKLWEGMKSIAGKIKDGVVGVFKKMYDVLVGHSIVPDTVNEILDWTGKLEGEMPAKVGRATKKVFEEFDKLKQAAVETAATVTTFGGVRLKSDLLTKVKNMMTVVETNMSISPTFAATEAGKEFMRFRDFVASKMRWGYSAEEIAKLWAKQHPTNNITITVDGSKDPEAVVDEIMRQLRLAGVNI